MSWAWYNEIDPYAAQWLRNLIAAKLISPGEVDERPIQDVHPKDLARFTRCHFFAGIAGWDIALAKAGWPADRPVWTGSCPCQSFSAAGQGRGFADERHLWPFWFHLIEQCRPDTLFGEQVASKLALEWFDLVHSGLESAGYSVGSADLPAASVGAPHIRQRLWFVAHPDPPGCGEQRSGGLLDRERPALGDDADGCGRLGDASRDQQRRPRLSSESERRSGALGGSSAWSDCDWLSCTDGKARPAKSGIQPLASGVQQRASKLRALGNSIVPQVAAEFIKAYLACRP